ncbi:DUF871 domain-containing protein [Carnobacterium gallinarum]|uniref:DUF871 domain-containing protein n=1 Tax=Carnobacterium gallinarum TaxID=2749 RepID=UPI0005539DF9|nr:MupG family TIM beta-alpha barrel fold protein [Carnobacterium gallinarum]
MFGISVFLGEDLNEETEQFICQMNENGFKGIFSSLHIPEDDTSRYRQRLEVLGNLANKLKMELMVDISGEALHKIGLSFDRPAELLATGITGLRMDYAIENQVMAELSQHLKVALNASTITDKDVSELKMHQANFQNMEAWHNYYPRPETGLAKEIVTQKNQWLKELGFRVMAFVPGNQKLRGPLFKGLPTLEKHRNGHPLAAAIELVRECAVEDIYLGDPQIDARTMKQFKDYLTEETILLHAEPVQESSYFSLILGTHENRFDPARDAVRSADARFREPTEIIPAGALPRTKGSITIDNQKYGRYMGEIQLPLVDLPRDEKVNVVGQVIAEDLPLINSCSQAGQKFRIKLV